MLLMLPGVSDSEIAAGEEIPSKLLLYPGILVLGRRPGVILGDIPVRNYI